MKLQEKLDELKKLADESDAADAEAKRLHHVSEEARKASRAARDRWKKAAEEFEKEHVPTPKELFP
jgi:hypothetical protein